MSKSLHLFAALVLFASTGCAARMALPNGLRPDSELQVTKETSFFHTKALRFGAYRAHGVDRSWTSSSTAGIGGFGATHAKQDYAFRLAAQEQDALSIACQTRFESLQFTYGRGEVRQGGTGLECALTPPDGSSVVLARLSVPAVTDPSTIGVLTVGSLGLDVRPINRLEGSAWKTGTPLGYSFDRLGKVIGAVQTANGGRVWIDPSADEPTRAAIASAAASLLLFEDIEQQSRTN